MKMERNFMRNSNCEVLNFNGKLSSLRYLCDRHGIDLFTLGNNFKLNRVQELYNSELDGNHYVEDILLSDNYEEEFFNLFYKSKVMVNRYEKLIDSLEDAEKNYCGIGISNIKKLLYELSKEDIVARSLKIALEIEEASINAKMMMSNFIYQSKEELILELIDICEQNSIKYGFGSSDILGIPSIVYFDLACGQLSWHTMLDKKNYPCYCKKWDGVEFATLSKIEEFIKENYL